MHDPDSAVPPTDGISNEKRLLIVDDEPPVRELLQCYFTARGYSVICASTGEEALRIAREHLVHLILLDYLLPDFDGLELIQRLRKVKSLRPVILMTGFGDDTELLENARNAGAADCVSKTSPLDQLLQKVELALAPPGKKSRKASASNETAASALDSSAAAISDPPALAQDVARFGISVTLALLSARHATLGNNAMRAAALAEPVAVALDLSPAQQQAFVQAAALHDIALLGWDRSLIDAWLRAPGKLNASDWTVVRRHPSEAQRILEFSPELRLAGEMIRCHHEHWDGTGFPDGLKGDAIPWPSRVLAVIVAYCNRTFATPIAFNELRQNAGTTFDRQALDVVAKVATEFQMPPGTREIQLSDLAPGMTLALDIVNHDGNLVLSKDKELTAAWINKVLNMHQVTPLPPTAQIRC